jgi:hypothetical protein
MLGAAMVEGGHLPGGYTTSERATGAAVAFLCGSVLFSILRSLAYLNVPVWEHVIRLVRAAR